MYKDVAIRKRRQKKIRDLKSKSRAHHLLPTTVDENRNDHERFEEAFPRYGGMYNSRLDNTRWTRPVTPFSFQNGMNRFKWIVGATLVILTYAIFNFPYFSSEKAQTFITEVMERDFNFEAVAAWYDETFDSLNFIPTFQPKKVDTEKVNAKSWVVPVSGVSGISSWQNRGIFINNRPGSDVVATEGGWVTEVKEMDGTELTIVIQHGSETESTYGFLDKSNVKVGDWVSKGQKIGVTKEDKLYFSIIKEGQYIDPNGVILFD